MNPVDQWRAIERLVALGWTEEAIGIALAQSVRQIKKLRLLANVLPAMLDAMAKGDMPNEQHLRTIAAATQDEQAQVWKKHKPRKTDPQVVWSEVARVLTKTRMFARNASFGDELAQAYGIVWQEDLFAPADDFEETRCATMGVFAPLVGIIGAMQAAEALKLLSGTGTPLVGRLQMLDARRMEWHEVRVPRNPGCAVCGGRGN